MALPQPTLPQSSAHCPHNPPLPVNPALLPQLCANLDTWRIMSPQDHRPQLQEHSHQPCKQYDLCYRHTQVRRGKAGPGVGCGVKLGHLGLSSDSTLTSYVVPGYLLLSQTPFLLSMKWGRYSPCPQPVVCLGSDATMGESQNPGHGLQTAKLGSLS